MAGGPLLPSSIYLGGAAGNLSPTFYTSTGGTVPANSTIEGIGVVASLGADAPAVLQFNMPEVLPSGTLKLRVLAWANATSGVAKLTVKDAHTAAAANIASSTFSTETQLSQTWATADIIVENKITLTTVPAANDIVTIIATFNTASWTLAATSVWQFSLVWE